WFQISETILLLLRWPAMMLVNGRLGVSKDVDTLMLSGILDGKQYGLKFRLGAAADVPCSAGDDPTQHGVMITAALVIASWAVHGGWAAERAPWWGVEQPLSVELLANAAPATTVFSLVVVED
uniref:Fibronectin type-III domain-containing protein n=1 Tax=Macrostomum lignano TaxID=282301 RepID=A0A1I8F2H3_9PLAT